MVGGKKITLEHVAAKANVSKITVSRALSHPDKVRPDTLARILAAADSLGYVANAAARLLKSNTSRTIGIVNPNMSNPFFGQLAKEMTLAAHEAGYDTLIFDSYESEEVEKRTIDRLISYGVDAIILSVISANICYRPAYLSRLESLGIPVILVDREITDTDYSGVYIDNFDCGVQIGRYLQSLGVQHITVVAGPQDSNVSIERVTGLKAILQDRVERLDILHGDFHMQPAYDITRAYLHNQPAPDFFVGANNQISLGIIQACIEENIPLQQGVGLFSVDAVPLAEVYGFHIPCIHHNIQEIAYQALDLAIRSAIQPETNTSKVVIRGSINLPEQ